ncbi:MAG: o-succinylbenzoate--CoA ligase [Chloroflexota bacterium]
MDWLRDRAKATPSKLALIFENNAWDYAELDQMTNDVCHQLIEAGAKAGELVAMLMPATETAVCLVHAVARLQMTLVPLNLRLTSAELSWQLAHTQADWLVHDGAGDWGLGTEAQRLGSGAWDAIGYKTLTIQKPQLPTTNSQSTNQQTSQLPDDQESTPNRPISQSLNLQSPQAIVFTSGTTGNPKGVVLTFENHIWSANASAYRLGLLPDDRWVSCLPLYHVGGLAVIFRSCLYGTAVILHQKFDLDAINHSLDVHGGTMISVVPTMLYRLLETRDYWPDTLRLILVGGAAASPALVEQANRLERKNVEGKGQKIAAPKPPIVSTTYGLTEAASQVATQTPEDTAKKPGSVGKPIMFSNVRIVDKNGRSLPVNKIGEVVVSGRTVMQGYFANEQATVETIQDGELYSGDVGYLDEDGDLWLVQRRSDIIVTGGENVYPAEVEKVLKSHPAIKEICVAGIPSAEWGELVAAMIVLENNQCVDTETLSAYGRKQLAGYKQPRHIQFTDALPLTGSGKIHRKRVKELLDS